MKADHRIKVMSRKVQEDSLQSELYPHIVTGAETDRATRSLFFEAIAQMALLYASQRAMQRV